MNSGNRVEIEIELFLSYSNITVVFLFQIAGVMYWSDWGTKPCIERADMDGGNRQRLIVGNMTWPNGLAIDFATSRIYWTDGGNQTIEYANLDGTGRSTLIGEWKYLHKCI